VLSRRKALQTGKGDVTQANGKNLYLPNV